MEREAPKGPPPSKASGGPKPLSTPWKDGGQFGSIEPAMVRSEPGVGAADMPLTVHPAFPTDVVSKTIRRAILIDGHWVVVAGRFGHDVLQDFLGVPVGSELCLFIRRGLEVLPSGCVGSSAGSPREIGRGRLIRATR